MEKEEAIRSLNKLNPYIEEIAKILRIKLPPFAFCDYLFELNNGKRMGMNIYDPETVPKDSVPLGAFYNEENGTIFLSLRIGHLVSNRIQADYMSLAEYLYLLVHELRHVWQRQYHYSEFYSYNSHGLENLYDPSEIDADGFAIAYVFSNKTTFDRHDFPFLLDEIAGISSFDQGKRIQQAKKLAKEYSFENNRFF